MKKEDFYGKWILRWGDLLPEQINESLWKQFGLTIDCCKYLDDRGLLFDNYVYAVEHYRCIMGSMKKSADERMLHRQESYEKIKEQAIKDLVIGPQETILKMWEAEKQYKKAFDRVLKRDGVVTGESLAKELNKPETIKFGKEETKKRIYISGPISGHNPEECRKRFEEVEQRLIEKGYRVFNPMNNGLPFDADTHQHMRRDLNVLTNEVDPFDYIFMMKRWPHSSGCKTELDNAIACGISVMWEESEEITKFE